MEAALRVYWMMGATLFIFGFGGVMDRVCVSQQYVNKINIGPGVFPTPLSHFWSPQQAQTRFCWSGVNRSTIGCPGELAWLAGGIKLKKYVSSSPLFYLCLRCGCQNVNTTLRLQLPTKFGNIVRVEASRYLTKITTLRKADLKSARSKVLPAKHTVSLQLICTVGSDLASRVP